MKEIHHYIDFTHPKARGIYFIITAVVVISFLFYASRNSKERREEKAFQGIIVDKAIGIRPKNSPYLIFIQGQKDSIELDDRQLYEAIDWGNYIIKRQGELFYTLVDRNNDTSIFSY